MEMTLGGHTYHLLLVIFFSGVLSDLTITVSYKDQNQQNTYRQILFSEIILNSFQQCVCNSSSVACVFTYSQGSAKSVRYILHVETKTMPSKELEGQLLSHYVCQKVLNVNKLVCMRQRDNGSCPVPGTQQYYTSEETCAVECVGVVWIIDQAMMVHSNVTSYLKSGQCPSPCTVPVPRNTESTTDSIQAVETESPNKSTRPTIPHVDKLDDDDDNKSTTFIIVGVAVVVVVIIILTIVIVLLWKRYLTELTVRNGTQILNSSSAATVTANENYGNLAYSQTSLYNDVFVTYDDVITSDYLNKNVNVSSSTEPTYATVNKGTKQQGQRHEEGSQYQVGVLSFKSSQPVGREGDAGSLSDHVYSRLGQETRDGMDMYDVLSSPGTYALTSIVAANPPGVASKGYSLAQPVTE